MKKSWRWRKEKNQNKSKDETGDISPVITGSSIKVCQQEREL